MERETRETKLLRILRKGRKVSNFDIIREIGTTTPRDIVYSLRKQGVKVESLDRKNAHNNKTHKVYFIDTSQRDQESERTQQIEPAAQR